MKLTTLRRALFVAILLPVAARAQLPSAELHSLYPPVIRAGETIEITVAGLHLEDLTGLHFSDSRIKSEPVPGTKSFQVTVPAEVSDGPVEIRADGYFGRSTSRFLTIAAATQPLLADAGGVHHQLETAPELPLETLAYGRTDANRTDYWKFTLTKGQRILIHCQAERIDSRADATLTLVDGRNYELERSRDAIGRDPMIDFTAPADDTYYVGVHDFLYNGGDDYPYLLTVSARPWIDAVYPPAGQEGQVIEATLLGRNLPGGSPGEGFSIDGKPVETLAVRIPVAADTSGTSPNPAPPARAMIPTFEYRLEAANPVRIGIAENPVVTEVNGAELPPLTIPCEVAARFDSPGDTDAFRFTAKAGTAYWIEVIGDRLSGRVDPYLVLEKVTKDAAGAETFATVRDGDDTAAKAGVRFHSGSRDTAIALAAGEAAEYRVTVVNQFADGGPAHLYRLAIREARPDYELVAVTERPHIELQQAFPYAPLLRKGGTAPLRVLIDRKDGFDGPVTLEAGGLPLGVNCPPVTAGPKEESVRLILQASADAAGWIGEIKVTGRSKIGETEITREARSGALVRGVADATKERLSPRLSVSLPLSVSATEKAPVALEVGNEGRFTVEMGQKLEIPIKIVERNGVKGPLVITADGLQGLRTSPNVSIADKAEEGKLTLDFKPQNNIFAPEVGTWTFVLKATGTTSYRYRPEAADRAATELKTAEEALKNAKPEEKDALTKARNDAEARSKAATAAAAAKDLKFTSFSLPITVEVKAAPEAKKDS